MSGKISAYDAHGDQRKARMKKQIFSELGGFVAYEPALLARYLDEHGRANGDVLAYFTQTEHGDAVTEEGIAVPYWASAALKFHSTYNPYIMTLEFSGTNVFF